MTSDLAKLTLNNGVAMPALGLGVYRSSAEETLRAVSTALAAGYRLIDPAAAYRNEAQVGEAIRRGGIDRRELFVTTKLWISDYGYDTALHGFERSMRKLVLDTADLYLLHSRCPMSGSVRSRHGRQSGASLPKSAPVQLVSPTSAGADLIERTGIVPLVNQVELHPFFTQIELRATHERLGSPRKRGRRSAASCATSATIRILRKARFRIRSSPG